MASLTHAGSPTVLPSSVDARRGSTTPMREPVLAAGGTLSWVSRGDLTFTQATDLLDWLEANGYEQREVVMDAAGHVTVRWLA